MGDKKEKDAEKKTAPEVVENQETDTSTPEEDSKPEPKSEAPDKSDDKVKALQGQISKLQKELNKKTDIKNQLKTLLGEEQDTESDVDPVKALTDRLSNLESELQTERAENVKNSYIDDLTQEGLSEGIKKYLKKRVTPTTDVKELEKTLQEELNSLQEVLSEQTPTVSDSRPFGAGAVTGDALDATHVLENPEAYNK
jgi:DNA repair exonuclease SbcCD ATPase subunit